MALLTTLPPELLELIFHVLGSIDDVHHFGRACKKTCAVIQPRDIYVKIMRSVITASTQHRYDRQLSRMLDLHRDIVHRVQTTSSPLPVTQHNIQGHALNEWEFRLQSACTLCAEGDDTCLDPLSDETVYDILARYQGLRVLENIWLRRQLNEADFLSADDHASAEEILETYQGLLDREEQYREDETQSPGRQFPETKIPEHHITLTPDERARFYSAVVHVWLLHEIRWVLTNFDSQAPFHVPVQVLEKCKEVLAAQQIEPLLEGLDQYAVFRFLYHHLLPLSGMFLADRDSSKLPFTFQARSDVRTGQRARFLQLFLTAGQAYFQPPDLIDLFIRHEIARKPPWPLSTLPQSTELWQRPLQTMAIPAGAIPLGAMTTVVNPRLTRINTETLAQLRLISRCSFHQTQSDMSPDVASPTSDEIYQIRDHANYHFFDRAMAAFELHEEQDEHLRNIRDVFVERWDETLWNVWWWAGSEEKARAKMERWRRSETS